MTLCITSHANQSLVMGYVDGHVPDDATDLTVAVVGEPRAARILPRAMYDPSGARMRQAAHLNKDPG